MITRNTVLVLGAGASQPFGYPTGEKLLQQIARPLLQPNSSDWLAHALTQHYSEPGKVKFEAEEIHNFGVQLHFSQQGSIDAFLERRKDFEKLGKLAIVEVLTHVNHGAPYEMFREPDWYRYLWRHLQPKSNNAEDLLQNKLKIITFNYDFSWERYLVLAIENTFRLSRNETLEIVKKFPIRHVYGSIGTVSDLGSTEGFEERLDAAGKAKFAESIKVIRDGTPESFKEPREWLASAEAICFLGFGFDETNLKRLGLFRRQNINGRARYPRLGRMVASSCGLTPADLNYIRGMIGHEMNLEFTDFQFKCLDSLKHSGVLLQDFGFDEDP